jgi:hypothetical protein
LLKNQGILGAYFDLLKYTRFPKSEGGPEKPMTHESKIKRIRNTLNSGATIERRDATK